MKLNDFIKNDNQPEEVSPKPEQIQAPVVEQPVQKEVTKVKISVKTPAQEVNTVDVVEHKEEPTVVQPKEDTSEDDLFNDIFKKAEAKASQKVSKSIEDFSTGSVEAVDSVQDTAIDRAIIEKKKQEYADKLKKEEQARKIAEQEKIAREKALAQEEQYKKEMQAKYEAEAKAKQEQERIAAEEARRKAAQAARPTPPKPQVKPVTQTVSPPVQETHTTKSKAEELFEKSETELKYKEKWISTYEKACATPEKKRNYVINKCINGRFTIKDDKIEILADFDTSGKSSADMLKMTWNLG